MTDRRRDTLAAIHRALNTADGQALLDDLRAAGAGGLLERATVNGTVDPLKLAALAAERDLVDRLAGLADDTQYRRLVAALVATRTPQQETV